MLQMAVFVDAGYLYAQGSVLLAGSKQARTKIRLNVAALLADLVSLAKAAEPNARLLRIYWYDGVARGGILSHEQKAVSESENVKCRFGTINGRGEQKGVDSLIVTDLIELARTQAISDALIVSGDEDIRVGVQVAQTYGIRVHLLGLHPARSSQSPDLIAESDTLQEWGQDTVEKWLTIVPDRTPENPVVAGAADSIDATIDQYMSDVEPPEANGILQYMDDNRNQLPADFDRPALARARTSLGRDLDPEQRKEFRAKLREAVRQKAATAP